MMDRPKLNMITYLFMLYQSGLIALGKVENPITHRVGVEEEELKSVMELFVLLDEKTKGNLTTEEERTLHMLMQTLKTNYDEYEAGKNGQPSPDPSKQEGDDLEIH